MSASEIRFPVAVADGRLVWADVLAARAERSDNANCVACSGRVVLRAGARNRPHFAHHSGASCSAGETALHATTVRVLAERISTAAARGEQFDLGVSCERCRSYRNGNLARHGSGAVDVDRPLEDLIRPDILIRSADGVPRVVIEVVVTHAPEQAALDVFSRLGLPVVLVSPSWDTLAAIRDGLPHTLERTQTNPAGCYELIGYECTFARHPRPALACGTCSVASLGVTVEVASIDCYRCYGSVPVLDIIVHRDTGAFTVAASCVDLMGVRDLGRRLGVTLESQHSQTAGGEYLMHLCPHCRAKQGDNFVYGNGGTVDLSARVHHFTVCADGHWTEIGSNAWPAGTIAIRVGSAIGLVGRPAGVFQPWTSTDSEFIRMTSGSAASREFIRHVRGW